MRIAALGAIVAILLFGCSSGGGASAELDARNGAKLQVKCQAFAEGMPIAERHSGYYDNVSPALSWSGPPASTKSFAILVDDPDAPGTEPFTHWMVANLPSTAVGVPEAIPRVGKPPVLIGGLQGKNGMDETGYFGPKPGAGPDIHHYHFRVYAVDSMLDLKPGFSRQELLDALREHILADGETVGTFARR